MNREHTEKVSTGIPDLDRILRGGMRRNGLHLLVGEPGAGKSVLAHQIASHHVRAGGRVLYLTALVESHQTLVSQARSFDFFDPSTVAHTFYYASISPALMRDGLRGVTTETARLVQEHRPSLLILDGLQTLAATSTSILDYYCFLNEIQAQAGLTGATTLLLANYDGGRIADPKLAIPDAILELRTRRVGLRSLRLFAVWKMRGVPHLTGWHTFDITGQGLRFFPRLEAVTKVEPTPTHPPPTARRLGFGLARLDEMLRGGFSAGSLTLLPGAHGAGKTLLSLAFLAAGAAAGERGVFFGFHESPDRLLSKADGVGIPLRQAIEAGRLRLIYTPSTELIADQLADQILAAVDELGARRLVVDGIEDIRRAILPRSRTHAFLTALAGALRAREIGTLLTQDLELVFGFEFSIPLKDLSAIIDNIVLLRYVELHSELRRIVAILKVRDSDYDTSIREFLIGPEGIRVGSAFDHAELLLTGMARLREGGGG